MNQNIYNCVQDNLKFTYKDMVDQRPKVKDLYNFFISVLKIKIKTTWVNVNYSTLNSKKSSDNNYPTKEGRHID